jgi:hypothetical protein
MLKSIFAFLLTIILSNALPNYVCTTSSEIDYYSNNIKDQFNFPSDWKQISTNNTCTYECEPCFPYAINNKIYNIGYHLKCGNVDNMINTVETTKTITDQLEEYSKMLEQGLISSKEHEALRKNALGL